MRWINHKIISFGVVFGLTGNFLASVLASVGSIMPDLAEGLDFNSQGWRKRHRTYTHWLLWWVIVWGVLFMLGGYKVYGMGWADFLRDISKGGQAIWLFCCFWLLSGWVLHILQDALSGGIPIWHPKRKVYFFKLFPTGHVVEYVISVGVIFIILWVKF